MNIKSLDAVKVNFYDYPFQMNGVEYDVEEDAFRGSFFDAEEEVFKVEIDTDSGLDMPRREGWVETFVDVLVTEKALVDFSEGVRLGRRELLSWIEDNWDALLRGSGEYFDLLGVGDWEYEEWFNELGLKDFLAWEYANNPFYNEEGKFSGFKYAIGRDIVFSYSYGSVARDFSERAVVVYKNILEELDGGGES